MARKDWPENLFGEVHRNDPEVKRGVSLQSLIPFRFEETWAVCCRFLSLKTFLMGLSHQMLKTFCNYNLSTNTLSGARFFACGLDVGWSARSQDSSFVLCMKRRQRKQSDRRAFLDPDRLASGFCKDDPADVLFRCLKNQTGNSIRENGSVTLLWCFQKINKPQCWIWKACSVRVLMYSSSRWMLWPVAIGLHFYPPFAALLSLSLS